MHVIKFCVLFNHQGQFSYWLLNRHKPPKRQTGIPAGTPPLDPNGLTFLVCLATTVIFLAWIVYSIPMLALLLAFPVTTLLFFVIYPTIALVLIPMLILRWHSKPVGAGPEITLKIAAGMLFCGIASATQFIQLYTDKSQYKDLFFAALSDNWQVLQNFLPWMRMLLGRDFDIPSLSWPSSLSIPDQVYFGISLGLAAVAGLLPVFRYVYHTWINKWGRRLYPLVEVILTKGEPSDDEANDKVERDTPTGRGRLKTKTAASTIAWIQVNLGMFSATVCSKVQSLIVRYANRGKSWLARDYSFVIDGTIVQFARDNGAWKDNKNNKMGVKVVHLANCRSATMRSLQAITDKCTKMEKCFFNDADLKGT